MGRVWRVWHPELPAMPGAVVELSDAEAHHVRRVLRVRPGQTLAVFDGAGREWHATLLDSGRETTRLRLEREVLEPHVEPAIRVVLVQGLLKPDRMDWVVQKATELGVAAVRPLVSARSESYRPSPRRLERWRRVAIEACKQSGRRRLPAIEPLPDWPRRDPECEALILDPGAERELGQRLSGPPVGEVWLAAGPQSGFERDELAAACDLGWTAARLGPRVLRADSAGVVAATIVLHRWGDLGAAGDAD